LTPKDKIMGFFSKLKFGLKLTADSTKARLALPVCIETAKKVRCNAAQLRVIKREAALLGAPDTFLDALRRIIEVETTNVEAACACQAVVNATDEKQIDLARTEAAVFIANEAMNAANAARGRSLEVFAEVQPGWLAGAEVMQFVGAPGWDELAG
jgi:hypothetical protein